MNNSKNDVVPTYSPAPHKLIIAEKPSVARAIAKALGVHERKDGYMQGGGYIISWCIGHLVGLAAADLYAEKYAKWRYDDLPILPGKWRLTTNEGKRKQFNILKTLMHDSRITSLICATDAGREGELIFRFVYEQAGCKKPFERLWISSMEEKAICDGFANLKDGSAYDNLYASALCRARADWLVGINATRLYSVLYNHKLIVGRVQSPTLAMLVDRDERIRGFVKEKFYRTQIGCGEFDAVSEQFKDRAVAEAIASASSGRQAMVTSIVQKTKTVGAPRLYDLTSLQRDANRLLGYTAQQTLDYAQSLYEKKLLTYPRTDSRFLTEDMRTSASVLISHLIHSLSYTKDLPFTPDVGKVIDNEKVTDHHAIIPTAQFLRVDPRSPKGSDPS